jgi:hypothetical protein
MDEATQQAEFVYEGVSATYPKHRLIWRRDLLTRETADGVVPGSYHPGKKPE